MTTAVIHLKRADAGIGSAWAVNQLGMLVICDLLLKPVEALCDGHPYILYIIHIKHCFKL